MCTYVVTSRMNTVQEPPNGHNSPSFFQSVLSKLTPQPGSDALANEPSDKLKPDRCQFTFSDGRQCRHPAKVYPQDELSPVKKVPSLCTHHAAKPSIRSGSASRENGVNEGSLPSLEALCGDLTTATNINRALAQVFLLMAQGRIAQKQAVAFGYLAQLLLQTVPGIRSEFVSAFGYQPWETKLKTSLTPNKHEAPEPSLRESGHPIRMAVPSEQRERGISPVSPPLNNVQRERRTSPTPLQREKSLPHRRITNPNLRSRAPQQPCARLPPTTRASYPARTISSTVSTTPPRKGVAKPTLSSPSWN